MQEVIQQSSGLQIDHSYRKIKRIVEDDWHAHGVGTQRKPEILVEALWTREEWRRKGLGNWRILSRRQHTPRRQRDNSDSDGGIPGFCAELNLPPSMKVGPRFRGAAQLRNV